MRSQQQKLIRGKSTKAERKFMEILKQLRIPFRTKVRIKEREVDFLIGKLVIEIDSHKQDVDKNKMLMREGYSPIHFNNWEITDDLKNWLKLKWQEQVYTRRREQPLK